MSYDITKLTQLSHLQKLATKIKTNFYNKTEVNTLLKDYETSEDINTLLKDYGTKQDIENSFKNFKYPKIMVTNSEDGKNLCYSKNKVYLKDFAEDNYEEVIFEQSGENTYKIKTSNTPSDRCLTINNSSNVYRVGFYASTTGQCREWYLCGNPRYEDNEYKVDLYTPDTLPDEKTPVYIVGKDKIILENSGIKRIFWPILSTIVSENSRLEYGIINFSVDTGETQYDEELDANIPIYRDREYPEALYEAVYNEKEVAQIAFVKLQGGDEELLAENFQWYFKNVGVPQTSEKYALKSAEGWGRTGKGENSLVLNAAADAAKNSTAMGEGTNATGENQLAIGKYNEPDENKLFMVGYGSNGDGRTVLSIDQSGNVNSASRLKAADDVTSRNGEVSLNNVNDKIDDLWWGETTDSWEMPYADSALVFNDEGYGYVNIPENFFSGPGNYKIKVKNNDYTFTFTWSQQDYENYLENGEYEWSDYNAGSFSGIFIYQSSIAFNGGPVGKQYMRLEKEIYQPLVANEIEIKGNILSCNDNDELIWNGGSIGGSTQPMVSITYAQLKQKRDNGQLIPGMQYRITDYECTTTQVDTRVVSHPFDIIVTADKINKLNENARACLHDGDSYYSNVNAKCKLEAWQLKYCLDNNTTQYTWTSSNGKGVIYQLKDDWGNECPYDFKQIQFKRYRDSSLPSSGGLFMQIYTDNRTNYTASFDTNLTTTSYSWRYTFDANMGIYDMSVFQYLFNGGHYHTYNNIILPYDVNGQKLNNIVFINCDNQSTSKFTGCSGNYFDISCYNITLNDDTNDNKFGLNCYDIIADSHLVNNKFGSNCHHISLWKWYINNIFENEVSYLTLQSSGSNLSNARHYYHILNNTSGTNTNRLFITTTQTNFKTYIGKNSVGEIKQWNPADLVT